jgi:excisionase family DNA binding protein
MPKVMLSVDEACAAMSIKRTLLYSFLSSGELGSIKVRGRRLIPMRALEVFVEHLAACTAESE